MHRCGADTILGSTTRVAATLGVAIACAMGGTSAAQDTPPLYDISNPSSLGNQRFGQAMCFGLVGGQGGGVGQQVLAVASPWANMTVNGTTVSKAGCVTVFREFSFGWLPMQAGGSVNIVSPKPVANGTFGQSVSMSGSFLVVGAPGVGPPLNSGRAYLYEWAGGQGCDGSPTSEWCLRGTLSNIQLPAGTDPVEPVDLFGTAVANLGSIVAVSAPSNNVSYPSVQFPGQTVSVADCGSVTIFAPFASAETGQLEWRPVAFIKPPVLDAAGNPSSTVDPSTLASGYFGSALAMNGSTLVIGSKRTTATQSSQGAVYVYDFDPVSLAFTFRQRLVAPASLAQANEQMGSAVSSQGGRIVAGAPNRSGGAALPNQGAAYVFEREPAGTGPFVFRKQLRASDAQAGDLFGACVDVRDTRIVIGAPGKDYSGAVDRGAAYVFDQQDVACNDWIQTLRLSPDLGASAAFGNSVGVSQSSVFAVGAPGATSPAGPAQGIVQLYSREQASCPADLSGDGVVDGSDITLCLSYWGPAAGGGYYADYTGDGVVNGFDLTVILASWGQCSCAPPP